MHVSAIHRKLFWQQYSHNKNTPYIACRHALRSMSCSVYKPAPALTQKMSEFKVEKQAADPRINHIYNKLTSKDLQQDLLKRIRDNDTLTATLLLNAQLVDLNEAGAKALELAISYSPELVDQLINYGADISALPTIDNREVPLWIKTCKIDSELLVREMLEKGIFSANDTYKDTIPLRVACQRCNKKVVDVLLEYGAKPCAELIQTMYFYKGSKHPNFVPIASKLLDGLDVNSSVDNNYGNPPFNNKVSLLHMVLSFWEY